MTPQGPPWIKAIHDRDPEFGDLIMKVREAAIFSKGALDVKTKLLIAFALDAADGHPGGAKTFRGAPSRLALPRLRSPRSNASCSPWAGCKSW
ncbi:MAG TPA: hypothetical protein VKU60_09690 [Chloroflexota bacterium]|nr:hypothetical protein [Chloroflexota bacterium]